MSLNPWYIDIIRVFREHISIDIMHEQTGELRNVELSADDVNNIIEIGEKRIGVAAEILRRGDSATSCLEEIIGMEADSETSCN